MDGENGNIVRWYPGIDNSLSLDDGNRTAGIDRYNVPPVLTDTVRLEPGQLQQHRRRHRHGHGVKTIATTIVNGLAKSVDDKVALHHSSDDTEQRRIKQPLQPESLTFFGSWVICELRTGELVICELIVRTTDANLGYNANQKVGYRESANFLCN